jgi:hypothetical protein
MFLPLSLFSGKVNFVIRLRAFMEVLWRAVIHFGTGKLLQLSSIQHRQFFSLTCVVSLHNYTEKKKTEKGFDGFDR